MDNSTINLLIATIPPTITAITSLIIALNNSKHIGKIHVLINSRMDQLLELNKNSSRLEGAETERKRNRLLKS